MGSWNGQCLLSGLSINWNAPAKAVILQCKGEVDPSGQSRPDEQWVPVGLPMTGTYDTYGSIDEIEEGRTVDLNWKLLEGKIFGVDRDYKKPDNMGGLLKMAERGYMHWKDGGHKHPIGIALIHDQVWTDTIEFMKKQKHWSDVTFHQHNVDRLEREEKRQRKSFESMKEYYNKMGDAPREYEGLSEHEISGALDLWRFRDCEMTKDEWLDYALIQDFLHMMGKKWDVQANKGGQDNYWVQVARYNTYVAKTARKMEKDWQEECDV